MGWYVVNIADITVRVWWAVRWVVRWVVYTHVVGRVCMAVRRLTSFTLCSWGWNLGMYTYTHEWWRGVATPALWATCESACNHCVHMLEPNSKYTCTHNGGRQEFSRQRAMYLVVCIRVVVLVARLCELAVAAA